MWSVKSNTPSEGEYVSRAAHKLASVTNKFKLNFSGKEVLDVGSSTGGFTDFALQHGAAKVVAVDSGTEQLHHTLRSNKRIELHEKTDIRDIAEFLEEPDIILVDVSFVSLRDVLPHIASVAGQQTQIVAMVKPQFEANTSQKNQGIVKNDTIRRQIFKEFETWSKKYFVIIDKADSQLKGAGGNIERFYLLKKTS